jgi:hypothetical protein
MAVTNAVSWRSEGIRHKKNEVFLDVVESVNLLVNSNGNVVLSEVICGTTSRGMHIDALECAAVEREGRVAEQFAAWLAVHVRGQQQQQRQRGAQRGAAEQADAYVEAIATMQQ